MTPPAAAGALAPRPARERSRLAPGVRRPRRVSGPARRPPGPGSARRVQRRGGLLLGLLWALERVSSHRLLERLVRGRAWLGLVTFALIGIVTLQLALLKLNGAVGRDLQSEAALQRENATLSIENSELAATDRVQSRAAQLGMEFAPSSALGFLSSHPSADLRRSATVLSAPARTATAGAEASASGEAASGSSASSAGSQAEGAEPGGAQASAGERSGEGPGAQATGGEAAANGAASPGGGEAKEGGSQTGSPAGSPPSTAAGGAQAVPGG